MAAGAPCRSGSSHVKELIRRRYAERAARKPDESDGFARALHAGYSAASLTRAPRQMVNAWSGCGNLAEFVTLNGVHTVVDLGCGSGLDAWLMATAPRAPKRVMALDLTPETLIGLRKVQGDVAPCRLSAIAGDMALLPLADACCDLVTANASINLALDKQAVFTEAARVLRAGGRLYACELVREGELPVEILSDPMGHAASLGGVTTEEELFAAITEAGFMDVQTYGHRPFPPVIAITIQARKPDHN